MFDAVTVPIILPVQWILAIKIALKIYKLKQQQYHQ